MFFRDKQQPEAQEFFYILLQGKKGNISKDLKKKMVKTLVWSVAFYSSETWTLRKEDIKRIQAFEMWIWCKMEKISWTAHVLSLIHI